MLWMTLLLPVAACMDWRLRWRSRENGELAQPLLPDSSSSSNHREPDVPVYRVNFPISINDLDENPDRGYCYKHQNAHGHYTVPLLPLRDKDDQMSLVARPCVQAIRYLQADKTAGSKDLVLKSSRPDMPLYMPEPYSIDGCTVMADTTRESSDPEPRPFKIREEDAELIRQVMAIENRCKDPKNGQFSGGAFVFRTAPPGKASIRMLIAVKPEANNAAAWNFQQDACIQYLRKFGTLKNNKECLPPSTGSRG